MPNAAPIGIFDSGIGGLTVAQAIHKLLPKEQLVYFGDTLHLPYGDKSQQTIIGYAEKITRFLISKKSKIIVIACNTASAYAYEAIKKICDEEKVFCVDVIHPIVKQVLSSTFNKIGVIGTRGTIHSNIYGKKIETADRNKKVCSLATPLLVPMIEEGVYNHPISKEILAFYLKQSALKDIETLILGCTHYPLLYQEIENFYNHKIPILDGAHVVALAVQDVLEKNKLLSEKKENENEFFISEYTEVFEKNAQIFFQEKINLSIRKDVSA